MDDQFLLRVEGGDAMNACKKCAFVGETKYCPNCGAVMRHIIWQDENDILVQKLEEDNISGAGFHVGCGSVVYESETSSGKRVFSCHQCCLRVVV